MKCHKCEHMGHYANECRAREHNLQYFRNLTNNREFRPNTDIFMKDAFFTVKL